MHYHFFYPYAGSDGVVLPTNCWTPLKQDAVTSTIYGHNIADSRDYLIPKITADGQYLITIYEFDTADGVFNLQLEKVSNPGVPVKMDNVDVMVHETDYGYISLVWDTISYKGTDTAIADSLALLVDTVVCVKVVIVPELMIHFSYETIGVR